jgi:hypothetical protein
MSRILSAWKDKIEKGRDYYYQKYSKEIIKYIHHQIPPETAEIAKVLFTDHQW